MQRLQNRLLSSLRAAFSLRRRLFLCTTATSPAPFVAESYLVANCGLTPSQALKASKSLSNLKSSDQLDAVRAFLADLSLSKADVASTIARSPRFLCCNVEQTLAPRVSQLRDIGLSTPQIARLAPLAPGVFVSPAHASRLAFYMSFLGSFDKVHAAIRRNTQLLSRSLESAVKPNIVLLRQCGLAVRDIAQVFVLVPRLLAGSQERLKAVIARAEDLGVPRGTPMFRYALVVAYSVRLESATAKMELLKSLGWSSCQVAMAVAKMPSILSSSEDRLRRAVDFLTKEAGVEVEAIARAPAMLKFSIEGRLVPRLNVLKLLKEKGLPGGDRGFYNAVCMSDETFLNTFVRPNEASLPPGLTDAHAAALAGKAPTRAAS
ncbi:uncharacterized protein LOC133924691 [Phragmites australis]|uniref:uncharacterized protein LOC133924691 n=1 Tax=Phragmites australis TaxID=29695 RepID=UPI002D78D161|nr:uncharacterized protein LOC133924691 [Phragmites australis]